MPVLSVKDYLVPSFRKTCSVKTFVLPNSLWCLLWNLAYLTLCLESAQPLYSLCKKRSKQDWQNSSCIPWHPSGRDNSADLQLCIGRGCESRICLLRAVLQKRADLWPCSEFKLITVGSCIFVYLSFLEGGQMWKSLLQCSSASEILIAARAGPCAESLPPSCSQGQLNFTYLIISQGHMVPSLEQQQQNEVLLHQYNFYCIGVFPHYFFLCFYFRRKT